MKAKRLRILLIINPISGTSSKKGLKKAIERRIRSMGHTICTQETQCQGDGIRIGREAAAEGYDVVLACGGDGTVNEVATGLIGSNTALMILPNGSGNGLARHLDIPVDPLLALDVLKKGHIVDCDYCTVNGRPFFCTFGLGFDAAVSRRFALSHKRGLMTYLKSAVDEFINFKPETCSMTINGSSQNLDIFLIACCNASQYGNNAYIAPAASITDGLLDITIVHSGNPIAQAFVGIELLAGSITKGGLIDTFRAKSVIIERKTPGTVHIDGEPTDMSSRLEIDCHSGGLRIYAPLNNASVKPVLTPLRMFFRDCGIAIGKLFSRVR